MDGMNEKSKGPRGNCVFFVGGGGAHTRSECIRTTTTRTTTHPRGYIHTHTLHFLPRASSTQTHTPNVSIHKKKEEEKRRRKKEQIENQPPLLPNKPKDLGDGGRRVRRRRTYDMKQTT